MSTLKLIVSIALIDVPYEKQSLFVQLTSPYFPRGGSIMCPILLILDNLLNPWTISIQETGIYMYHQGFMEVKNQSFFSYN